MKPDWDKLMDDFKDSPSSLIADVDCTAEGKDLCSKMGVRGYPTIKWGDPADLKDYEGGRELSDLKKFAEENLGPSCGPDNLDLCDDDSKASIAKFQAMSPEELEKVIEEADAKIASIEAKGTKEVAKLEAKIKGINDEITAAKDKKDKTVAKESAKLGLRFKKSVAAAIRKKEEASKAAKGSKKKKKGKKEL